MFDFILRYLWVPILLWFMFGYSPSAESATEPEISAAWCETVGGVSEHRFDDGTRVDCLTDTHAIEFDWAPKWAEAVGQSLKYASNSGRRAGIMLILKRPYDQRYYERLDLLIQHYGMPIDVWFMYEPVE